MCDYGVMANSGEGRACTVVLHDDRISEQDVLSGNAILSSGELAYLSASGARPLCVVSKGPTVGGQDISIHVRLAYHFGFENRAKAYLRLVSDPITATATHVELVFRDQHLSRADMWRIVRKVDGLVVYRGQSLSYMGTITAQVEALYVAGKPVESALVTYERTKAIFRSCSAHYTILVQISKEMLEYWYDGNLMYERLLSGFLPDLFRRWEQLKAKHLVSIVLFGRLLASKGRIVQREQGDNTLDQKPAMDKSNADGSLDFYHVIANDAECNSWPSLLRKLRAALNSAKLPHEVSQATPGNLLEAVHIAATGYAGDDVNPDLQSTGSSIIAITAGAGIFDTTHNMLRYTTRLLMGNSIGVDIVALSPEPLHPVPLFRYARHGAVEYALPHWVDISYYRPVSSGHAVRWLLPECSSEVADVAIDTLPDKNHMQSEDPEVYMAEADDQTFCAITAKRLTPGLPAGSPPMLSASATTIKAAELSYSHSTSVGTLRGSTTGPAGLFSSATKTAGTSTEHDGDPDSSIIPSSGVKTKRDTRLFQSLTFSQRKISLGPRGLAPGKGIASTTVSTQHAQHGRNNSSDTRSFTPNDTSSGIAKQIRLSLARKSSQQSLISHNTSELAESTMPIDIAAHGTPVNGSYDIVDAAEQARLGTVAEGEPLFKSVSSPTPRAKNDVFYEAMRAAEEEGHWDDSPWLTLLNPCNPKRDNMRVASQFRKWQNVFPIAVSSTSFKWSSMCTPAALPLTTAYRPKPRELEQRYNKWIRRLSVPTGKHSARMMMYQLIGIRLARGFQLTPSDDSGDTQLPIQVGDRQMMSLGAVHHELTCISSEEIQVIEYSPKERLRDDEADVELRYRPKMRTHLGGQSRVSGLAFGLLAPIAGLSAVDDHIVGTINPSIEYGSMARFVLIPFEPVKSTQGLHRAARDLSDEERRIDGIQRLTQLWQRHRHRSDEELLHQASLLRSNLNSSALDRDPNPLAIEYHTRDSSAIVNAYGGPALLGQPDSALELAPLFAESELYHSSTFDLARLVKQMQERPPQGVEVKDRRWFARMHFKCFRGDEMVNWLLRVFKNLDTREDALTLGNQLMDRDVFTHVRGKHEFRDGNYFYQITSSFRTTHYPDNASMFNKAALKSVPSTPIMASKRSPMIRTSVDSDSSNKSSTPSSDATDRKQLHLSQMMQCNVDPGKKSEQLEVVDLHYDRIHNPENCYGIRLHWTTATTKLIKEAITRWAALVDPYGLRLVQIPLKEACELHHQNPFDLPIYVKLKVNPPDRGLRTPHMDPHAGQHFVDDGQSYHKALLRKLNFALDTEAAASFTAKLDVMYSYGAPQYKYTQFVHTTGQLLAQITADHQSDFLLVANRLANHRYSGSGKMADIELVEEILRKFRAFCMDADGLKAFYREVNKPRVPLSPFASISNADSDVPVMQLGPHLLHRAGLV